MDTRYLSSDYLTEAAFPFWIDRTIHTTDEVPPVHSHEFVELIYVISGKGKHYFEGKRYQISAGDVFIINPGENHTYEIPQGESLEIINCLFVPSLIEESWLREAGISQSMDYFYVQPFLDHQERFHHLLNLANKGNELLYILEMMINEFYERRMGYSKIIRLKLVEMLILLSRFYKEGISKNHANKSVNEHQLLVSRICGYLERHYNQKLSVETLCELFTISTRQLNRIFKQVTNRTVIEMVQHIRIEQAKYFLQTTDEKVITIAGKVGYDDPAFFSRLFLRYVGIPPGKYRSNMKTTLSSEKRPTIRDFA